MQRHRLVVLKKKKNKKIPPPKTFSQMEATDMHAHGHVRIGGASVMQLACTCAGVCVAVLALRC